MRERILRLNREYQMTVLISSHLLDELSKVATHYGFINNGRIVKEIREVELEVTAFYVHNGDWLSRIFEKSLK